ADQAALGWALGTYEFTRYKPASGRYATLVWPDNADRPRVAALLEATGLCRDLINTPAEDLGPRELVRAGQTLGKRYGAKVRALRGQQLERYPAVQAVGRASERAPELLDLTWGNPRHPKLTL